MNYLKEISNIKSYNDFQHEELKRLAAKDSACRVIEEIAHHMYLEEYDRRIYKLWDAILSTIEAIKCQD